MIWQNLKQSTPAQLRSNHKIDYSTTQLHWIVECRSDWRFNLPVKSTLYQTVTRKSNQCLPQFCWPGISPRFEPELLFPTLRSPSLDTSGWSRQTSINECARKCQRNYKTISKPSNNVMTSEPCRAFDPGVWNCERPRFRDPPPPPDTTLEVLILPSPPLINKTNSCDDPGFIRIKTLHWGIQITKIFSAWSRMIFVAF